jgi:hypothetical protein
MGIAALYEKFMSQNNINIISINLQDRVSKSDIMRAMEQFWATHVETKYHLLCMTVPINILIMRINNSFTDYFKHQSSYKVLPKVSPCFDKESHGKIDFFLPDNPRVNAKWFDC